MTCPCGDRPCFRHCVWCLTDCGVDEPAHAPVCPQSTGLIPWDPDRDEPMLCGRCPAPIGPGDHYVLAATDRDDTKVIVCVGCGARAEAGL